MRSIRWFAVIPFLALIVGPFFVNPATPLILGLPFPEKTGFRPRSERC
jgi:hypothetical protein